MKKKGFLLTIVLMFVLVLFGCACEKEVDKEEALNVLKEANVKNNVEITTVTETTVSGVKSSSTQTDIYYDDKYYHSSEINSVTTKTWYGYVDDVLYAFYYTKNANNEEHKNSTKIEQSQLDSALKQPTNVISVFFDENNNFLDTYTLVASKKGDTYTIEISNENDVYTFNIKDNKITKLVKNSSTANDSIKVTYTYNYNVDDITLPTLSEYPLTVSSNN